MADYALEGPRWGTGTAGTSGGTITWAVDSTVPTSFLSVISAAFLDWSAHANIKFQQVASNTTANITFSNDYIDGLYNTLGYANYSYSSQKLVSAAIKFDSGEGWHQAQSQVLSSSGANLFVVALHEIGHAIGIDHYNASKAVMNAVIDNSVTDLKTSDINGVQALYGAPLPSNTLAQAYGTIIHSTIKPEGEVYALYTGLLGRAPDYAGLKVWVDGLNGGMKLRDVTAGILSSPEAQQHLNASDNAAFVEQLYETVLGRHGDTGSLQSWTAALNAGSSRSDVAESFVFSSEHLANLQNALLAGVFVPDPYAADVARLYYALLDRAPDPSGLQSLTSAIEKGGASLHDVASMFLASGEYRTTSTGYSDAQFVDALYQQVLGRTGDSYGVGAWNGYLAQGGGRGTVVDGFTSSAEFQGKYASLSNSGYVEQVYEHVLGRAGDLGAVYWTHSLDSGQLSRTQVAQGFSNSAEFQAKYVAPSDATFVDSLYENALGRHADTSGRQLWTNALAHGMSRADVALGIAQSGEAHQHLLGQIEQGWHLA